jgi:hypothetical protein
VSGVADPFVIIVWQRAEIWKVRGNEMRLGMPGPILA